MDTFRNLADLYETALVPVIFQPYATVLVERARPIGPADRILDLGCGTGIVARTLRARLGGAAAITGVDVSAPMLAKARAIAPDITWQEGNAMTLPFADASFDLIISQQMLQFVPDRAAAVREVRRVLAPGGRAIFATWRPRAVQPLFEAIGQLAERHLGPCDDKRWSLDGPVLRELLVGAGFAEVEIDTASLEEHWPAFPVRGSALAANHAHVDDARLQALEAAAPAVLAGFAAPAGGYVAPTITNVAIVR